ALAIPETEWKTTLSLIKEFRRRLKKDYGIYVTVELHATDFVAGRGKVAPRIVPKGLRCHLFCETLKFVASLPGIKIFNAIGAKHEERLLFERLINRINTNMKKSGGNAVIIHDEGKDYTFLVRRMGVFNPIQSMFGAWGDGSTFKNIPIGNILEDIIFRDSEDSFFIQLADFCAYALFRSEYPLASKTRYKLDSAFANLHHICIPICFAGDPKKLGIIRVTCSP
ncbi:MAG TPA: DUF3800 domain-containing protein, partial [Bryobacteraceae bacterium]|nr:DUF3800 domain-containing protein [Bryobacteraceae bacterium]